MSVIPSQFKISPELKAAVAAKADSARRVRTRRTNHDWSDNIKNTHVSPFFEKKKSAVSSRSPLTS